MDLWHRVHPHVLQSIRTSGALVDCLVLLYPSVVFCFGPDWRSYCDAGWISRCVVCNESLTPTKSSCLAVVLYGEVKPFQIEADKLVSAYAARVCTWCSRSTPTAAFSPPLAIVQSFMLLMLDSCIHTVDSYSDQEVQYGHRMFMHPLRDDQLQTCIECNTEVSPCKVMLPEFVYEPKFRHVTVCMHNYCSTECAWAHTECDWWRESKAILEPTAPGGGVCGYMLKGPSLSNMPRSHSMRVALLEIMDLLEPLIRLNLLRNCKQMKTPRILVPDLPYNCHLWQRITHPLLRADPVAPLRQFLASVNKQQLDSILEDWKLDAQDVSPAPPPSTQPAVCETPMQRLAARKQKKQRKKKPRRSRG